VEGFVNSPLASHCNLSCMVCADFLWDVAHGPPNCVVEIPEARGTYARGGPNKGVVRLPILRSNFTTKQWEITQYRGGLSKYLIAEVCG
jgi:hypothetical protein